jgi:molybdate transport system substrate-binding protein
MRSRRTTFGAAVVTLVPVAVLTACGSSSSGAPARAQQTLTVFGAASLATAFTALGAEFEDAHPGTSVHFDFDSSTILAQQITDNPGTADVFASADEKNMQLLEDAHEVAGTPTVFAKNEMEIAVEPGNPEHVQTVADLAKPELIVVLCATEAPCGKYADQLLERNNVKLTPKSRELNATSTLGKVSSGDADAAIVYVTDVKGAGSDVDGVAIPTQQNVVATLPIAALKHSRHAALADEWVDFVTSSATEQALRQTYGFLAP